MKNNETPKNIKIKAVGMFIIAFLFINSLLCMLVSFLVAITY